jgi:hypothetical protein
VKVIAYQHTDEDGVTTNLVYDTADVEAFETPRDVHEVPGDGPGILRELGKAHLHLHFRQGTQPRWEKA